jgi:hypothetical protein
LVAAEVTNQPFSSKPYLGQQWPGAQAYGSVVINNRLTNNGLPGVAMHSHTPGRNLNDNVIIGNHISGTR